MTRRSFDWLLAEVAILVAYGGSILYFAVPMLWIEKLSRQPEPGLMWFYGALAMVGLAVILSNVVRRLEPFAYVVAFGHAIAMFFVTPNWIMSKLGGDSESNWVTILVYALVPFAAAFVLHSPDPPGRRLSRIRDFKPRLRVAEIVVVALGAVAAFGYVFIGGRWGQLLFAVFVFGPLVGLVVLGRIVLSMFRRRKKRDPRLPVVVSRTLRVKSGLRRPVQPRHHWTISEFPAPGDQEDGR